MEKFLHGEYAWYLFVAVVPFVAPFVLKRIIAGGWKPGIRFFLGTFIVTLIAFVCYGIYTYGKLEQYYRPDADVWQWFLAALPQTFTFFNIIEFVGGALLMALTSYVIFLAFVKRPSLQKNALETGISLPGGYGTIAIALIVVFALLCFLPLYIISSNSLW